MPSTFDAAFAAFGNDQAGALLSDEVAKYDYADKLATMRVLLDEHTADFWSANLYTSWLSALRALSPTAERVQEPGVPTVARTEAWGRRLLNTQLASWAELRHNTVLYVKQSYSEGVSCEFPDVYVDPYPEFFAKVAAYADRGQALVEGLTGELEKYRFSRHFEALGSVARELEGMAQQQRDGIPFTQAQMDFINDAVAVEAVCGGEYAEGWYARLFFDPESALEYDPTIVDVHTQPDDEFGNRVGKVLHLGTGNARLMVMTAETCNGPRAYVGVVSSYYEKTTENFERLTDEEWKEQVRGEADVSWLDDVLVGYSDP